LNAKCLAGDKLPLPTISKLWDLGICSVQKTQRGVRAGKNKVRQIKVHNTAREPNHGVFKQKSTSFESITNFSTSKSRPDSHGVCTENLTYVPLVEDRHEQPNSIEIMVGNRPENSDHKIYEKQKGSCLDNLKQIMRHKKQSNSTSKNKPELKFGVFNAQSAKAVLIIDGIKIDKATIIHNLIVQNDIDCLALVETWLRPGDTDILVQKKMTPEGYRFEHIPRSSSLSGKTRGGGLALIFKKGIAVTIAKSENYKSLEYLEAEIKHANEMIRLITLYRPPSKSDKDFLDDFGKITDLLTTSKGKSLIVGDFNYHVDLKDKPTETKAKKRAQNFLNLLDNANLIQHVNEATHKHGHTLDLVISRIGELKVNSLKCDLSVPSDHYAVLFGLSLPKPERPKKEITIRKWKDLDIHCMKNDIKESLSPIMNTNSVSEAVQKYNTILTEVLEKHVPCKRKTVTVRYNSEWINTDIKQSIQKRRKLEEKWRKSRTEIDREMYKAQRDLVNIKIERAKTAHYSGLIKSAKSQKEVFKVTNKLLHKQNESILPSYTDDAELANRFVNYFTDKIVNIREGIEASNIGMVNILETSSDDTEILTKLSKFRPVTEAEVLKIIKKSPSKSCGQDPIPTWLLKECQEVLLPVITVIVNLSLTTSTMPDELKEAHIAPLIKKAILDPEILKNFRPVSNLAYLSKLIERVVAAQYIEHLKQNGLCEDMQSAYREFHSTETALLRVQNDILLGIDKDGAAILVLLDLSAAFDTIDHKILLSTLENEFGITGQALAWFESYLTGRHQLVKINGVPSEKVLLKFGVPQGSVLGPLLFISYTKPLGKIIKKHGLQYHLYADDTQLYLAFSPSKNGSAEAAIERIQNCVQDIKRWMSTHFLKLNEDKTEILVLGKNLKVCDEIRSKISPVNIGGCSVTPVEHVRNLGVIFDSVCNLHKYVGNICKGSYHQIRNIGSIRKYLDTESTKSAVHAHVTSRLDYCNSLLFGISNQLTKKLQRVQNTAARLITRTKKFDHIKPVLQELHWLPIEERIKFKILLLAFKAQHGLAPKYISDLVVPYAPTRSDLRSQNQHLLDTRPKTKLKSFGDRSFKKAAAVLWNSLPIELRTISELSQFKSQLKTHLFKNHYSC
jgi:hypothetical protein